MLINNKGMDVMKKILWILGAVIMIACLIAFTAAIFNEEETDSTPFYWPGRDTYEWWSGGVCQIVGETRYRNNLIFQNEEIGNLRSVYAYKEVGKQLFFIMAKGKIVVDLDKLTYERYSEEDVLPEEYQAIFDNPDSFKWMPEKERFWH